MSWEELAWVKAHSTYKADRYVIHLLLADLANGAHGHELWLSQSTLAHEARTSRQTVNATLAQMCADGYLERLTPDAPLGRGQTVHYRFLMPESVKLLDTYPDQKCQAGQPKSVKLTQETFLSNIGTQDATASRRQSRRTSVPESFALGERVHAWKVVQEALDFDCDLERERDRFLDWHRSKGNTMADWDAAFRTWIGNFVAREKAQHKTVEVEVNPNSFGRIY